MRIRQSKLESAKNTGDSTWHEDTFANAEKILEEGGIIHIVQEYSDTSSELVAIIDTPELLDYYRDKYAP